MSAFSRATEEEQDAMIAALDKEEADSEMAEGLETTSLESPKV
jgi:hypothetical protein